jgi:hypothetical protein
MLETTLEKIYFDGNSGELRVAIDTGSNGGNPMQLRVLHGDGKMADYYDVETSKITITIKGDSEILGFLKGIGSIAEATEALNAKIK